MSQLDQPRVLHLATKRLLLRTLCARLQEEHPDESRKARELLRDIEHDLNRADAAEREIVALKRSNASLRGNKIAAVKA